MTSASESAPGFCACPTAWVCCSTCLPTENLREYECFITCRLHGFECVVEGDTAVAVLLQKVAPAPVAVICGLSGRLAGWSPNTSGSLFHAVANSTSLQHLLLL